MVLGSGCGYSSSLSWAVTKEVTFNIFKFSLIVRPRGHKPKNIHVIQFPWCPLGFTSKLNFKISKTVCSICKK